MTSSGLRAFAPEQPAELPLGLNDAPLARMRAGQLLGSIGEIARLVKLLEPVRLVARIEQESRGGISSPAPDGRVSGSRAPKLPALDARDKTLDRRLRDYEAAPSRIVAALQLMLGIQEDILDGPREPTPEEKRAASDLGVDCRRCSRPVACTPQDRLRAGLCGACYAWFLRAGKPDIVIKVDADAEAL